MNIWGCRLNETLARFLNVKKRKYSNAKATSLK